MCIRDRYKDAAVSASANLAGYADAGELDSWASEAMSWALSVSYTHLQEPQEREYIFV